ncbi:MAG: hypothetical protein IKR18_00825 [Bacteroidaceae bacterium]|jgi:uncharacterized membrane protein|nr:hypothetical protein [Bacteroidaceae bacterium]
MNQKLVVETASEDEMTRASSAYLMSLIAVVIGLPMPIINLVATGIFFFMSRRAAFFVRWNCVQAFLSQIPLFVMNNILFWWTVRILFGYSLLSNEYVAYFVVVNIYNLFDLFATVRSAMLTRRGRTFRWFFYSTLTDKLCRQ